MQLQKSEVQSGQYSGYPDDYSTIKKDKDYSGESLLRWISPELKHKDYSKLLIQPVQFHPEPQPTEQVSEETLIQIREYFANTLRREAAKSIE